MRQPALCEPLRNNVFVKRSKHAHPRAAKMMLSALNFDQCCMHGFQHIMSAHRARQLPMANNICFFWVVQISAKTDLNAALAAHACRFSMALHRASPCRAGATDARFWSLESKSARRTSCTQRADDPNERANSRIGRSDRSSAQRRLHADSVLICQRAHGANSGSRQPPARAQSAAATCA
jgi:hypothetical protein